VFSRRFQRRAIIVAATFLVVALTGGFLFLRSRRVAIVQVPFSDLLSHLDSGGVSGFNVERRSPAAYTCSQSATASSSG